MKILTLVLAISLTSTSALAQDIVVPTPSDDEGVGRVDRARLGTLNPLAAGAGLVLGAIALGSLGNKSRPRTQVTSNLGSLQQERGNAATVIGTAVVVGGGSQSSASTTSTTSTTAINN
ncbi:MAG: hypothetical protein AB8B71_06905 [Paracoccaceae bacterium]